MLHHTELKKWLRKEYLVTHADFDGFQAKGNIDMLNWFIPHHARVDFRGTFRGTGCVRVG